MTREKPIRFAAVGAGRVFQRYHLPCVDARDDVELVGLVDADADRAASVAAGRPGVWTGTDVARLIREARPDALSVCTPNDAHAAPVLAALDAGIPVLCEKPLAATVDEARRMAEHPAAAELLAVNMPFRCHSLTAPFAEAAGKGAQRVEVSFVTPGNRVWRACTPWYGDARRAGGGALLDLGPHAIDLLMTVFGHPDVEACTVNAEGVEEQAELQLSFQGLPATIRIDRAARRMETAVTVTTADGAHVLDLRRNELRLADGTVRQGADRPELAAISAFFDAVTGAATGAAGAAGDGPAAGGAAGTSGADAAGAGATGVTGAGAVGAREALAVQLVVDEAYRRARGAAPAVT
ncbi:Gfo/Idh/MocA family oxidoreductase [Streptomyces pactum]|uniref:Gfo/Idh/MocA family oxidoreductase n=1 Tax=Streptomyces pactum TaxID=68249 RepID=A8R0J9_9ACTN|nr:Gfo/Idh/MocA family oxidoreductase [Streptomyces pactum]ACJ24872.1 putative NAD dependent dehydrogenase [Streptomyces pactum]MBH5336238.1 Gfo/Idh/MocA family oxidoreductase [Streptomyces pactum]BAF92598.1 putative NAD dependent dehydrogenase [Streptomyces pactum]